VVSFFLHANHGHGDDQLGELLSSSIVRKNFFFEKFARQKNQDGGCWPGSIYS